MMSYDDEPAVEQWSPEQVAELRRMAQIAFGILVTVEAVVLFIVMCLIPTQRPKRTPSTVLRTMIVLGSGARRPAAGPT